MKKVEIYTNYDGQDFTFSKESNIKEKSNWEPYLKFELNTGSNYFSFLPSEEVDEFCELLQKKKKEIWKS